MVSVCLSVYLSCHHFCSGIGWISHTANVLFLIYITLPSVLWCCWPGGRKGIRPAAGNLRGAEFLTRAVYFSLLSWSCDVIYLLYFCCNSVLGSCTRRRRWRRRRRSTKTTKRGSQRSIKSRRGKEARWKRSRIADLSTETRTWQYQNWTMHRESLSSAGRRNLEGGSALVQRSSSDFWTGDRLCWRSGGTGGRAPMGVWGGEAPRSWSTNAFCVIVKAFSWIPECKSQCMMYKLTTVKLRTRNHPSLRGCFGGMTLIPVPI